MPIENYTTKEPIGKLVTTSKRSAWDDLNEFEAIDAEYDDEYGSGYYPCYEKATIDAFKRKYESELKQIPAKD